MLSMDVITSKLFHIINQLTCLWTCLNFSIIAIQLWAGTPAKMAHCPAAAKRNGTNKWEDSVEDDKLLTSILRHLLQHK